MTRYFFNIRRSAGLSLDEEGQLLSSATDARFAAISALCEIAGDSLRALNKIDVVSIEISTADGRQVEAVTMLEAIGPLLPSG
jgi:hypothetical protein